MRMQAITLVGMSGPSQVQADPIEGSPDGLVVIRKWRDDPHAFAVAARIPGHDAWMSVARQSDLTHPNFPHGTVRQSLETMLAGLPAACEAQSRTARSIVSPVHLGVARYLGILTDDQVASRRSLLEQERSQREEDSREKQRALDRESERRLSASLEVWKKGEMISAGDFEDLLAASGIVLPPRTLSTLRTRVSMIGRGGARLHGGKMPEGIWRAVQQLWEITMKEQS
jgi:hypothetical protein